MRFYYTLLLLCSSTLGYAQSKSKPITEFSQNDINDGILIDVRTPQEYNSGHLENAVNIDWLASDFIERSKTMNKEEPIYLYCKKGGRSAKAAHVLDSIGFKQVVDLEGGYDAFIARRQN